jgi:hypothetical protein
MLWVVAITGLILHCSAQRYPSFATALPAATIRLASPDANAAAKVTSAATISRLLRADRTRSMRALASRMA